MNAPLTPHGPGFSFLDSFEVADDGKRGLGKKWLDPALPFFADHFPGEPLMPGVLLVECGAQTAGALWGSMSPSEPGQPRRFVLAQIVQFKIGRPVLPGQTLESEAVLEKSLGSLAQFAIRIIVNQLEVAQGRLVLGIPGTPVHPPE